jgi:SNF family Na+-dependent transporter
MGIAFIYQLSLAAVAILLCMTSLTTSRRHRHKHVWYMGIASMLIAASVLGGLVDMLLDAPDTLRHRASQAMMPLGTILLCVVPIWRARQARRIRKATHRYRRTPRPLPH